MSPAGIPYRKTNKMHLFNEDIIIFDKEPVLTHVFFKRAESNK